MDTGPWFPYREAKGRVREIMNIFQVLIWNSQKDWTGCTQHLILGSSSHILFCEKLGEEQAWVPSLDLPVTGNGFTGASMHGQGNKKVNLNPPLLDLNTPSPVFGQAHDFHCPNIPKLTGIFWRGTWTSTARGLRGCHVKKLSLPSDQALYDTVG